LHVPVAHFATRIASQPLPRLRTALVHAALFAALGAAGASLAQAPLSLPDALRLAEARSPQLAGAEYAAAAARERGVASSQLPDPILRLGVDNLPINGPDAGSLTADGMTMRRVGLMQEFPDSEKRNLKRLRGSVEADRELAMREANRATLRQEVALTWLDRYYALQVAQVWRSLVGELHLQKALLEVGVATGRSSVGDLRTVEAMTVQTEDQIAALVQQARVGEQMLARWLGESAQRVPGPAPEMTAVAFDPAAASALSAHPQLAVLQQDQLLAQTDLKLAERARTPDWSIEVSYQQRGPAYSNMVSIGVNIPLPLFPQDRQDRGVTESQARLAQAEALLEDARRQRQAELAAGGEEWRSLLSRARTLRETLLPLANDRVTQTVASYSGGGATLAQVLDARRAAVEAQMQVLLMERDAARVWARLNFQLNETPANARVAKETP